MIGHCRFQGQKSAIGASRRNAVEMLKVLVEATGLVLGSFLVAIGLIAATWSIFVPIRHPDWGALAIILALIAAFTTHLLAGEFLSMVQILDRKSTRLISSH